MLTTIKFSYWEDDGWFLGYLHDYPNAWTQGEDLEDLEVHLLDLYKEFSSGALPSVQKVGERRRFWQTRFPRRFVQQIRRWLAQRML